MIKHYAITFIATAILIGAISISLVSADASYTIDFEGLAEGAIIGELSCGSGITCPDSNIGDTVSVRAHNPAIDRGNTNTAMIFNADCVAFVDCTGEDDDLSFPGHGKTLINSEDLDQTDPDDQLNPGSFMEFDFSAFGPGAVTVHSIDVGDIEEREIGAFLLGTDGPCIGIEIGENGIPLPLTGNNVIYTVDFELTGVSCLLVHLNGSGAIDNIHFTTNDPSSPAITIEKLTNGEDADLPTGPEVLLGSTVEFSYAVSNSGNVDLSNVTVMDGQEGIPAVVSTSATIDFEGLAEGSIVSSLSCGVGISCLGGDLSGSVAVKAHNPAIDSGETNTAMIFNAECVALVDCTGEDDDLSFPGHGNTLINSEDLDQTDPDDQINSGSFMEFDFSEFGPGEVTVHGIDAGGIGDIVARVPGPFVEGTNGPCIGLEIGLDNIALPLTGDNAMQTVGFELTGVHCLHVHLNGSGTIDNIQITTEEQPVIDEVEVTCPGDTLAVGESMTCTGNKTATAGQYTNVGKACGDGAGQNVCDEDPSNHFGAAPSIDIEKATNGEDADLPTGPIVLVGSKVDFTYEVTNTGNVDLTNVSVLDDQGVTVTCLQATLALGESMTCTGSMTAIAGQYTNVGVACGDGAGQKVCDEDPSNHFGAAPSIDIEKATNGEDADLPTGPIVLVGSKVDFTYEVTNIGDVDLSNVSVLDDQGVTVTCLQTTLAVGESMTCTGSATAIAGQYTNVGVACGDVAGQKVCDEDPSNHFGAAPSIDIEKATNGEDADLPTGPIVLVGSKVDFTYEVTNTGNVDLTNVTVRDDLVSVPATGSASATIDFEGLAEGEIVSQLSCGSGISCPDGELGGTVTVRAHNPKIDSGNTNSAMIFNSDCVPSVDCTGGDDDLSFPGHGKTLINSADLDSAHPNDQINTGSFMEFDFSDFGPGEVAVHSIDVGDIEVRAPGAFVDSTDGPCIGIGIGLDELPLPVTGNNLNETVVFELMGVHCLRVHLNGSGNIDNINFTADLPAADVVEVTCRQDTLAVGDSMTCTGSTVATPGQYTNLGTACGDWVGQTVCDDDPSNHLGADSDVTIDQQTNWEDADEVDDLQITGGDEVRSTYNDA